HLIAASDFENNLEKTFQVSPGDKLTLQADQGTCEVTPVDGDKVHIQVLRQVKRGSQAQADELFANHLVAFHQDGNTVSIVARNKSTQRWSWRPNQSYLHVRYEITVPKKFDVELQTSGGDVQVGDLDGKVKARTSSGSINLGRVTGSVEARNSGGNIVIE